MKKLLNIIVLSVSLFSLVGCTGCVTTVSEDGPYEGNEVLANADKAITGAYDTLDAFLSWEFKNRHALTHIPEIRKTADAIRKEGPNVISEAIAARQAYTLFPNETNATALATTTASLKAILAVASKYLEKEIE